MSAISARVLFWTPRTLCIAFAIFLSLFASDVFNEGYTFWQVIIALLMHLIPAGIVLVILALAWRWEWVGTLLFAGVGIMYMVSTPRHPDWILSISGPLFLIAALFLLNWLKREQLHGMGKH